MKAYPEIPSNYHYGLTVYAFDKLDGSNIRVEWHRKRGFHKFGTRTRLLDPSEKPLGEAVELFNSEYWKDFLLECMNATFSKKKMPQEATFYFEFHGPKSFAGNHVDEKHFLTLIDVNIYKKGFIDPKILITEPWIQRGAAHLYYGNIGKDLIDKVKNSTLERMTFEGIVCKSGAEHKRKMVKFKSAAWLEKLKNFCGENKILYNKLK